MKMFFDKLGSENWRIRRRYVTLILLYCGGYVLYLGVWGRENSLSEAIATALIVLAGAVINGYIFGVVVDDKNQGLPPPPNDPGRPLE